ncbi:hypothetical protein FRC11_010919 [Ceratobasidium sp. 423]|nr:hypothetical protein FRC11_010919 [Ceratobasidium sp. 423]
MSGVNNTHVNGATVKAYSLLHPGENIEDPGILWLERFTTFLQRVKGEPNWKPTNTGNNNDGFWEVTLSVNDRNLDGFTGRGTDLQSAKANLVKQLQKREHNLLCRPLRAEYQRGGSPASDNSTTAANPSANEAPPADSSSPGESSTPNNGASATE